MDEKELQVVDDKKVGGLMEWMGTDVIDNAFPYVKRLTQIVEQQNLFTEINKKKYVHVDAWTLLGLMTGIHPRVISCVRVDKDNPKMISGYLVKMERYNKYSRQNETYEKFVKTSMFNKKKMKILKGEDGKDLREVEEIKYETWVGLYTRDGKEAGRAFSLCSNLEDGKLLNQEYSIASMSETRATGKVCRLCLSWIMTLAGFESTPNEDRETVTIEAEEVKATEKINPEPKKEEKKKEDPANVVEDSEPKKESKQKKEIKIPDSKEAQVKLWEQLIKKAKEMDFDVAKFLEIEEVRVVKASMLPNLIGSLSKALMAIDPTLGGILK